MDVLYVKKSKFRFFIFEIKYLGLFISKEGVRANPKMLESMVN